MAWCFDEILKQANSNLSSHFRGSPVFQIIEKEIRAIEGGGECVNGTPQVTIVSTRMKVIPSDSPSRTRSCSILIMSTGFGYQYVMEQKEKND